MPDNGESRPAGAAKRRRAVRNIDTGGAGRTAQTPYAYKRETKQQAAARIERELRMAAGMPGADPAGAVISEPDRPDDRLPETAGPDGDTRVFDAIDPVKAERKRQIVMTDAARAQREINEEIERRSRRRRTAYTVLIAAGSVIALSLIILIAARMLG